MPREENRDRIARALFGGSFDPVHRGHLEVAETVLEQVEVSGVTFLPAWVSPHKRSTVASPEQRAEMLRIALDEEGGKGVEWSRLELDREGPSHTWETVEALTAERPEIDWHWIVGTDQWNALERWGRPDILREKLRFIVCTRGGEPLVEREGWRSCVVSFHHPASSTAIREDFETRTDWMPEGVVSYCRREGLYGAGRGEKGGE